MVGRPKQLMTMVRQKSSNGDGLLKNQWSLQNHWIFQWSPKISVFLESLMSNFFLVASTCCQSSQYLRLITAWRGKRNKKKRRQWVELKRGLSIGGKSKRSNDNWWKIIIFQFSSKNHLKEIPVEHLFQNEVLISWDYKVLGLSWEMIISHMVVL